MQKADLDGLTIVVTRPAHQADSFCKLVESEGGIALRFPVIDIKPPADAAALNGLIERLDEYQIAIFISANAVDFGYRALGQGLLFPNSLQLAAVGKATANTLSKHGQPAHWVAPPPYNSEALLTIPEFQRIKGKHIVIFRGVGGREHLADALTQRGALVDYAECYQRVIPKTDSAPLVSLQVSGKLHLIVLTSNEAIQNLMELAGDVNRLKLLATPLVVISQRTAQLAREMGFSDVTVAEQASDAALLVAIKQWVQNRRVQA